MVHSQWKSPKPDSSWRSIFCNPFQIQSHTIREDTLRPVTKLTLVYLQNGTFQLNHIEKLYVMDGFGGTVKSFASLRSSCNTILSFEWATSNIPGVFFDYCSVEEYKK